MTAKELFEKELFNLYALHKQSIKMFDEIAVDFLSDEFKTIVASIKNQLQEDLVFIDAFIAQMQLNPTNTKDSVVEEILRNLAEIASEDVSTSIKNKGFLLSINRFIYYVIANLENVLLMSDSKDGKPVLKAIKNYENIHNDVVNAF